MQWAYFQVQLFVLSASFFCVSFAKQRVVTVGALFDSPDRDFQSALRDAVSRINAEKTFRPDTRLDWANAHTTGPGDSHQAANRVCTLLKTGIGVVIGPQSTISSSRVQGICNSLQVPHIEMVEDFSTHKKRSSVNIAPHPKILSKAFASLIDQWPWYDTFAVIYEGADDLSRIQDMLQFPSKRVYFFKLEESEDPRVLLKAIKDKGITRIVLAVKTELISPLFEKADEIGLTSEYYDYVIPNLDIHTINFEKYFNRTMNITGFQLIDPTEKDFHDILRHWRPSGYSYHKDITAPEQGIKTEVALLYDAILLYGRAISSLENSDALDFPTPTCEYDMNYHPRNPIIDKLKSISVHGLTGPIKFNADGQRTDFTLHIIKILYLDNPGFKKIATWSEKTGYVQILSQSQLQKATEQSLAHIKLKVTTIMNNPFFMEIPEEEKFPGGPRYEGFIVDLMEKLAATVNFTYEITPVADKQYGAAGKDGTWNGMVGELITKKADMCAADLTITQKRQDAVDFTIPFMHLGISILYKKPDKMPPSLFSFLNPFSEEVWMYMITAYLGVSVLMFLLARISPYEWTNPHPCNPDPDELENIFDLPNSMWCQIGALMQQGSDLAPKAVSTRMVAGLWWFFTLIMISSYTASLAAFLTSVQIAAPIKSVEDLASQTKIKYGTVKGGSTQNFFEQSNSDTYKKIWTAMDHADPPVFASSNDEGVARVKRGDYAFFMESTVIEYRTVRDCELMQIGSLLDSKGYGIATPKNSPHRNRINEGILKLQDDGILLSLKRRWWTEKRLEQKCPDDTASGMELGISNVGGVFVLLFVVIGVSCFIGAVEFVWNVRKNVADKTMFGAELWRETKFALSFGISTKPVPKVNEDISEDNDTTQLQGLDRYPSTNF